MPAFPHEDMAALNAFYGDPRGANGRVSQKWAAENLVMWVPPYPLFYTDGAHTPLRRLTCHKKAKPVFDAAFLDVLKTLGREYILAHRLDQCGGLYNYRLERGGSRLSVHAWAIAIDMDPAHNPFPHPWNPKTGLDQKFVEILVKHGFYWRGNIARHDTDPMHLQLAVH